MRRLTLPTRSLTARRRRGFTLLEVMIGITLLVIIVLPLASLYAVSLTTIQQSALYSQALGLARDRMELAQVLPYDGLYYDNESFAPGFEFYNGLGGRYAGYRTAYCCQRDDPTTPNFVEESYDPTDTDNEGYPVPFYRDYYNNFTGQLIDPNFNGLCDDDLNGDDIVDQLDFNICNPNGDTWQTGGVFQFLDGQERAGDGLYDTVLEGQYLDTYDTLSGIRTALAPGKGPELPCPIQDELLKYDFRRFRGSGLAGPTVPMPGGVSDYGHRNRTFDIFVRMTTIIDPTPRVGDPQNTLTLIDQRYLGERIQGDSWDNAQIAKFVACLDRDLPIYDGANTLTVAPHRATANPVIIESAYRENSPFNKPATYPRQGKKVIVRVLYLSGEGDGSDANGDGFPDGESLSTAKQVVLERVIADPDRFGRGNNILTGPDDLLRGFYAPLMKVNRDIYENIGEVVPDVVGDDNESDFCSEPNDGLPYYEAAFWPNQ